MSLVSSQDPFYPTSFPPLPIEGGDGITAPPESTLRGAFHMYVWEQ